ncbi:ATP-binding protein [Streptomyces sp. BE147]|uniref:sensor histidine kinase n=1 Tax=Streptomyces sp. BE147 TaxID=3002524 RepID=UPI002E764EDA|nr:ATP-binding protein [Streptomyces sp. BE147]MEE1741169.1 ATP-binding protein [Streptomyces sp. BE147]
MAAVPAGGAVAVSVAGFAGAMWWARHRDRAADREGLARAEADRAAEAARLARVAQYLVQVLDAGQAELARAVEQAEQGQPVVMSARRAVPDKLDGPFAMVLNGVLRSQATALEAVRRAAGARTMGNDGAELLVAVARRVHALVHRTLETVSDAQRDVEDPELLDALYRLDNLVTRTRRGAESIAVLGGHIPRQVASPLGLVRVLRQAIAEVEHYPRARQVTEAQIAYLDVPGYAVADVIHLLAQLIENATKFSSPETDVMVRASRIAAGVAIEIDDRGLTMSAEQLAEMNQLLLRPEKADRGRLLKRGTIGLLVTGLIAGRLGIRVDLQSNVLGGTKALVVLPERLLVPPAEAGPPVVVRPSSPPGQGQAPPVPGAAAAAGGGPGAIARGPRLPGAAPGLPRRTSGTGEVSTGGAGRPGLPRRDVTGRAVSPPPAPPGVDAPAVASPDPHFVAAWTTGGHRATGPGTE